MMTIPIFFTIDDNFTYYLDCAVRSIMDHASPNYNYQITVIHENLSESHIASITESVKPPFQITFLHAKEEFAGITDRPENRLRCDYFTMSIYFRLFIADMFPQYDKAIYIDSDVIVPGDISELYQKELGSHIFAACPDYSIFNIKEFNDYVEQALGVPYQEYINSGVLLMNLKMMRDVHFCEHFLRLMNTYHFDSVAPDQDYINAMCRGKLVFLDESWDAMPPLDGARPILEHPNLIHFNLFRKPWCYDDIPYEEYFWKYARQSPFYSDILEYKANYSDAKKQADQETLGLMLSKSIEIVKQDVTFQKLYESGEAIRI